MKYLIIFAVALLCVTSVPVQTQEQLRPRARRSLIFRGEDQNQVVAGPQGPRRQEGQGEQRENEEEEGRCAAECDNSGRGCDECRPCVGLVEGQCPEWCLEQCGSCAQCHGFQLPERRERREAEQQLVSRRNRRQGDLQLISGAEEEQQPEREERPEGPRPERELEDRVRQVVEEHDLDREDLEGLVEEHEHEYRPRPRRRRQGEQRREAEQQLVSRRNRRQGDQQLISGAEEEQQPEREERPEGPRPERELEDRVRQVVEEHDLDELDLDELNLDELDLEELTEEHEHGQRRRRRRGQQGEEEQRPERQEGERRRRQRRQEEDLVDEELPTVLVSRRGGRNHAGNHLKQQEGVEQRPEQPDRQVGEENNRQARQGLRRNRKNN